MRAGCRDGALQGCLLISGFGLSMHMMQHVALMHLKNPACSLSPLPLAVHTGVSHLLYHCMRSCALRTAASRWPQITGGYQGHWGPTLEARTTSQSSRMSWLWNKVDWRFHIHGSCLKAT